MPTALQIITQNNQAALRAGTSATPSISAALARAGQAPAVKPFTMHFENTPTVEANKPESFWHWVGDIIDRPRRAIADTVQGQIHTGEAIGKTIGGAVTGNAKLRDEGVGEIGAGVGETLSGIPRGLFSTNKSDQRSTSDIIERETDRVGGLQNELKPGSYTDTKDNVNPVLKGVAGVVGDIVTDPLTYVPIPGAGLVGKLLKTGTRVAPEAAVEVPKTASELALTSAARVDTRAVSTYKPMERISTSKVADTDPVLHPEAVGGPGDFKPDPVRQADVQVPSLAQRQATHQAVLDALPPFITEHFATKAYPVVLDSGAHLTETGGKGFAKFPNQLGTHAGMTLFKKLTEPLFTAADELRKAKGVKPGLYRANHVADQAFEHMKAAEALIDSKGGVFHLDWQGERIFMSPSQLFHIIDTHSPTASKALRLALFNKNTEVPLTNILEAAVIAYRSTPEAAGEALERLMATSGDRVKDVDLSHNFLAAKKPVQVVGVKGKGGLVHPHQMQRDLLDAIVSGVPKMRAQVRANVASGNMRFQSESLQMSDEVMSNIETLVNDPAQLGNALAAINGIPTEMVNVGKRADTLAESVRGATDDVTAATPEGVASAAQGAQKAVGADARGDEAAARAAANKVAEDAAKDSEKYVTPEDAVDVPGRLSADAYRAASNGFVRFIDPALQFFRFDRGMEGTGFAQILSAGGVARRASVSHYAAVINKLARAGNAPIAEGQTRTLLNEAIEHHFAGTTSANPAVAALQPDLAGVLSRFVPVGGGNSVLGGVFSRTKTPVEWLVSRFGDGAKYPGLQKISIDPDQIAKDVAESAGTGSRLTKLQAVYKQIGEQISNVDDIPQFLNSLSIMAHRAATEASVMAQAEKKLISLGLASKGPKTGMALARWDPKSVLFGFASQDLRLNQDGVRAMSALSGVFSPEKSGKLEEFLRKYFDPFQQVWKTGVTIIKPGHHVRNAVGNATMNFIAEGLRFGRASQSDAIKIMHAGHGTYDGFDSSKLLEHLGQGEYRGDGATIMSVKIGGKDVPLSAKGIYARLKDNGVLNSFHDVQGLDQARLVGGVEEEQVAKNLAQRGADVLTKNKTITATAGKLSEANDHLFKMQHAAQILRKFGEDGYVTARFGQKIRPKSEEELFGLLAERVRQYHPDGLQLTEFERRYLKRIIPFYGWIRGALPALAESAMMHPGRITAFPKASYNLAVANGVHPDSLADPFPDDQLFPSYLTDQVLGPQFKVGGQYFMASPGIASVDVANTFPGGNVLKGVIGSASPLLRDPIEIATGNSLTTGAPIKDWSDYVDQQLPGLTDISSLTGYSASGSAVGLATGNGLDQQLQVAKGNKDQGTGTAQSLLSKLLGVQTTNESQPNVIKAAQFEERDKQRSLLPGRATSF